MPQLVNLVCMLQVRRELSPEMAQRIEEPSSLIFELPQIIVYTTSISDKLRIQLQMISQNASYWIVFSCGLVRPLYLFQQSLR